MPTSYPDHIDSQVGTNWPGNVLIVGGSASTKHTAAHKEISDAIEALEAKVGTDGSTDTNSLDYKINNLELGGGEGDMVKSVYDTDNDGIVDRASSLSVPVDYGSLTNVPGTFVPSQHQVNHRGTGSDPIPLDALAQPSDNVNLNASPSAHGLLVKLENSGSKFLRDDGTWQEVAGGPGGSGDMTKEVYDTDDDGVVDQASALSTAGSTSEFWKNGNVWDQVDYGDLSGVPSTFAPDTHAPSHTSDGGDTIAIDALGAASDNTYLDASSTAHGLLPKLDNTGTKFLRDDGTWQTLAGGGDMLMSTYDADLDGTVTSADTAAALSGSITVSQVSDFPTLGTSATKDIPATGNASATEVVYGSDTRLTDSRTPATHASSHGFGQGDAVSITKAQVSDFPALGTASAKDIPATGNASATEVVYGSDTRLSDARALSGTITVSSISDFPTLGTSAAKNIPATGNASATEVVYGSDTRLSDARTLSGTITVSSISDFPTLGTSAAKNIPASGDASATEVVYGSDTRLTNARSPSAHAASHGFSQSDAISITKAQVSDFPSLGTAAAKNIPATGNASATEVVYGSDTRLSDARALSGTITVSSISDFPTLGTSAAKNIPATGDASATEVVYGSDTRLTNARTASAHAASHGVGQSDAVTITKAQVSDFPTLGTAAAKDIPASGDASATQVVYGSDTRLTNARTASAHAASHGVGQSDAVTLTKAQISDFPAIPAVVDFQFFTTPGAGSWTKPAGTIKWVEVICIGGGGAGGSGAYQAAGNAGGGGGGGAGGNFSYIGVCGTCLPASSYALNVGAGCVGATRPSTSASAGADGTSPVAATNDSWFGTDITAAICYASAGLPGKGGPQTTSAAAGGTPGPIGGAGGTGGAGGAALAGSAGTGVAQVGGGGGGGGGSLPATHAEKAGGAGGPSAGGVAGGGAGGVHLVGSVGNAAALSAYLPGSGGGGGGSTMAASTNPWGGVGGNYGGGGGGGGAGERTTSGGAGAGGTGAPGCVCVITYY